MKKKLPKLLPIKTFEKFSIEFAKYEPSIPVAEYPIYYQEYLRQVTADNRIIKTQIEAILWRLTH
jgi:hypothetical protein